MIKVWTDGAEAGLLDRYGDRGSTFAYLPEAAAERAVSVTMPVRLASWDMRFGLAAHLRDESAGRRSARASAPRFCESHRHV